MFTISFKDSNIPTPFNSFSVSEELGSTDIEDCIEQIRKMTDELLVSWERVVTGQSDIIKEFHEA